MDFREKVRRLVGSRKKSALSREAGLPPAAIDAVINKGRVPLVTNAIRIARVLGVPSDWLFDDSQDWPPPKSEAVSNYGDVEIVEELVKRRDRIIRDMRLLHDRLAEGGTLHAMKELADRWWESKAIAQDEKDAMRHYAWDLRQLDDLAARLALLSPDRARPPTDKPPSGTDLASISDVLTYWLEHEKRANAPFPPFDRDGRAAPDLPVIPFTGGFGTLIDRETYIRLGVFKQRGYVPLLDDPGNGPPNERPILIHRGQVPPERFAAFVRTDIEDGRAFACRVNTPCDVEGYPVGSIIVCDPAADLWTPDHCILPTPDEAHRVRVISAHSVLSKHPDYKSSTNREAAGVMLFRVAEKYAPQDAGTESP